MAKQTRSNPGSKIVCAQALAALLSALFASPPAIASPFHIPDADAATEWELKVFAEFESIADEDIREAPVFDITAPLRQGLETSVTFGWGHEEEGSETADGFLDFEMAVKAELSRQAHGAWASVAIEPALFAPTGTHGLSAHAWAAELPVIVSREYGALELRGLASYAHVFAEDEEDEVELGLLASVSLAETFSVGVEAGRDISIEDVDEAEVSFDVGAKWEFTPGYELQARVGQVHEDGEDGNEVAIFLERAF
jgi:hypothetical protein